jgi:hypothetical protein
MGNNNESHNKSTSTSTSDIGLNQNKRKRDDRECEMKEEIVPIAKRPKQEKNKQTDPMISNTAAKGNESDNHHNIIHSNEETESRVINVDTLRWSKLTKRTLKKVWVLFFRLEIFSLVIRRSSYTTVLFTHVHTTRS